MFDVFCWCLKWCLMMFDDVWWCLKDVECAGAQVLFILLSDCRFPILYVHRQYSFNHGGGSAFPIPQKGLMMMMMTMMLLGWLVFPTSKYHCQVAQRWPAWYLPRHGRVPFDGCGSCYATWGLTAGQRSEQVGGKAGCWGCTECCLKDLWEVKNFCEICWFRPTLGPRWGTRMFELGLRLYIYFLLFLRFS